jgi:hypothetical protein
MLQLPPRFATKRKPLEQDSRAAEMQPAWRNFYEGLTEEEVEKIHQSITR